MDEAQYRSYCEGSKKAQALCMDLRDLYGPKMSNDVLFARAMFDRVITEDERRLLARYYH